MLVCLFVRGILAIAGGCELHKQRTTSACSRLHRPSHTTSLQRTSDPEPRPTAPSEKRPSWSGMEEKDVVKKRCRRGTGVSGVVTREVSVSDQTP